MEEGRSGLRTLTWWIDFDTFSHHRPTPLMLIFSSPSSSSSPSPPPPYLLLDNRSCISDTCEKLWNFVVINGIGESEVRESGEAMGIYGRFFIIWYSSCNNSTSHYHHHFSSMSLHLTLPFHCFLFNCMCVSVCVILTRTQMNQCEWGLCPLHVTGYGEGIKIMSKCYKK